MQFILLHILRHTACNADNVVLLVTLFYVPFTIYIQVNSVHRSVQAGPQSCYVTTSRAPSVGPRSWLQDVLSHDKTLFLLEQLYTLERPEKSNEVGSGKATRRLIRLKLVTHLTETIFEGVFFEKEP